MDISNLTPEQIQLILSSGEDDPAFGEIDQKQKIAEMLMKQGQGRGGQYAGRVFVGPTPTETLANVFSGYAGQQMQAGANADRRQAMGRVTQGRQAYGSALIEALRRRNGAPTQPPAVSMTGPETDQTGPAPFGGF